MGRRSQVEEKAPEIDCFERVRNELSKTYGESIITDGSKILETEKFVIPVTPALDIALSGGIPEGSTTLISGKPKSGKSSVALWIARNAQKPENGSRQVYYISVENRLKEMNIRGTNGLDPEKFKIVQSSSEKILNAEEFLTITENIIKTHRNAVVIVDSFSVLCNSGEMTVDITGQIRTTGPKMLSLFFKRAAQVVPSQNTILIGIQHLIANTSGYGSPYLEDGGQKIQYASDIKIRVKGQQKWEESGEQIGQDVEWEVLWSALGPPGRRAKTKLRYGYGMDEESEIIEIACEFGLITKGGAWYAFGDEKYQGEAKFRQMLVENPDRMTELRSQIKKMTTSK